MSLQASYEGRARRAVLYRRDEEDAASFRRKAADIGDGLDVLTWFFAHDPWRARDGAQLALTGADERGASTETAGIAMLEIVRDFVTMVRRRIRTPDDIIHSETYSTLFDLIEISRLPPSDEARRVLYRFKASLVPPLVHV